MHLLNLRLLSCRVRHNGAYFLGCSKAELAMLMTM